MPSANQETDSKRGPSLRIACVIGSMRAGGAERVMAELCNYLAAGHEVTLILLTSPSEKPFYELSSNVRLEPIDRATEGTGAARIARVATWVATLRKSFTRINPHVVISFIDMTNVMVLLATLGMKLPVIVSERIDPAAYAHRLSRLDRTLRRLTYPSASRIVVQTDRAAKFFDTRHGSGENSRHSSRIVTIPNPVPATDLAAQPDRPAANGRQTIIGVGRLDHQKGFDILIDSFARVVSDFPDWDVKIFGEGSDRPALLAQIRERGLEGRIRLMGISREIADEMARAHIMAFPSRYEGFPNALAEGMAIGLPAVAFANVSGVEDLIADGETGLLADWGHLGPANAVQPFTDNLRQLMTDAELRARLGAAARNRIQRYAPGIIFQRWHDLITETAGRERF